MLINVAISNSAMDVYIYSGFFMSIAEVCLEM